MYTYHACTANNCTVTKETFARLSQCSEMNNNAIVFLHDSGAHKNDTDTDSRQIDTHFERERHAVRPGIGGDLQTIVACVSISVANRVGAAQVGNVCDNLLKIGVFS